MLDSHLHERFIITTRNDLNIISRNIHRFLPRRTQIHAHIDSHISSTPVLLLALSCRDKCRFSSLMARKRVLFRRVLRPLLFRNIDPIPCGSCENFFSLSFSRSVALMPFSLFLPASSVVSFQQGIDGGRDCILTSRAEIPCLHQQA